MKTPLSKLSIYTMALLSLVLFNTLGYGETATLTPPETKGYRLLNPYVLNIDWQTAPQGAEQLIIELSVNQGTFDVRQILETQTSKEAKILRPTDRPNSCIIIDGYQTTTPKLEQNTTYQIRARYKYPNTQYSAYCNPISIKTPLTYTGNWSSFKAPKIKIVDKAKRTEGSKILNQAIPDLKALIEQQCLAVCRELYADANEPRVEFDKITFIIVDDPETVGYKTGDNGEIEIGIGAQHIEHLYQVNGRNLLMIEHEIKGLLSHELTHGYQHIPKNAGAYDGRSVFWGYLEGMADSVRAELHNWAPVRQPTLGGNWNSGYETGGFFIHWCKQHKKPTFLIELNRAGRDMKTFTWEKAFQQILGQEVQAVWDEYQADIKATAIPVNS
jgi:hypothetical protein